MCNTSTHHEQTGRGHQQHVALSRVRRLDGVLLVGLLSASFDKNKSCVHDEYARLARYLFFFFFFLWGGVTGELSTLRQMIKVPNEPSLSLNNDLETAFLSDQSMASNPRKGQTKRFGAKTTSCDGKAGHVMTHVCHRVRQEERRV